MDYSDIENQGIDEKLFKAIIDRSRMNPALRTIGISVAYLGYGVAGMKLEIRKEFYNGRGILHGGIITLLADSSMGHCIQTLGMRGVTIDLNINFCSPITTEQKVIAEGTVFHVGKKMAVAESTLFKDNGKPLAKSRSTFSLIDDPDLAKYKAAASDDKQQN